MIYVVILTQSNIGFEADNPSGCGSSQRSKDRQANLSASYGQYYIAIPWMINLIFGSAGESRVLLAESPITIAMLQAVHEISAKEYRRYSITDSALQDSLAWQATWRSSILSMCTRS
jgi:hypothetical protein